jgi:4-alpha-glucanotransferase
MTTDEWGIDDGYWDVAGQWHAASDHTRRALRTAMGGHADVADPPPRGRPVWFVPRGSAPPIERPAALVLEDGTVLQAQLALPPDLPLGYHDLHPSDGGPSTRLIVTPPRCHLPEDLHTWGLAVQLYAARSEQSWGMGDLADLRRLACWSRRQGAGLIGVSPLHAALPLAAQEASPYFPSSRRFRNPLYLRVEEVPGAAAGDAVLAGAADAGRALNRDRHIDRDAVWALKRPALEHLWSGFAGSASFDEYVVEHGPALQQYATFCALVDHHGTAWPSWPTEHRRPDGPGVARFAAAHPDRVRFHQWLQWLLDEQLCAAADELPVLGDLAVGIEAGGADGWIWQDVFAHGVRVGAPPDEFNTHGQDWGFPPFVPWKLRAEGYEPLVQTLRGALRGAGALRIDHVMGLFRLYWIPAGANPAAGTYVRYPGTELLDIVALESVRAGAVIVGEDLGTVEPEVRVHLGAKGVLSYRLLWFEDEPPSQFPRQALASVTTHDLPTVAGLWTGDDLEEQRAIGLDANEESTEEICQRLTAATGVDRDAPVEEVAVAAYGRLAESPAMIVTATLDDALGVTERPNMPGTTTERPNWSIALPEPLESVEADPRVERLAAAMTAGRAVGRAAQESLKKPPG